MAQATAPLLDSTDSGSAQPTDQRVDPAEDAAPRPSLTDGSRLRGAQSLFPVTQLLPLRPELVDERM